ncbi:MAG: topoisomerase DNA-binding C4 zinc finger domain-containing protein [Clostridiales bacterium]|nr:topoisomerase DNA-binding C4 zinc finger domain-containing protein [Clostridiales bacterium]
MYIVENQRLNISFNLRFNNWELYNLEELKKEIIELFKKRGDFICIQDVVSVDRMGDVVHVSVLETNECNVDEEVIKRKLEKVLLSVDNNLNSVSQIVIQDVTNLSYSEKICPFCKSKMKIRNGINGKFYGCSSYPLCRHTEKL